MNQTKYLIFDFDGVLADSFKAISEYEHSKSTDMTLQEIQAKMLLSDESNKFMDPKEDQLKIEFRKGLMTEASNHLIKKEIPLFLDFLNEIKKIENTKLAIVTSNSSKFVKHLLGSVEHNFEYILGVEDEYLKSDKIKFICEKWGIDVSNIVYFTDTQRDVYQLENHMDKKKIYGCAWGWHGKERLLKVLPKENILERFEDIHNLSI
jgi:phosphoglycolate phosphatase-like HAD superfamily hydrolase